MRNPVVLALLASLSTGPLVAVPGRAEAATPVPDLAVTGWVLAGSSPSVVARDASVLSTLSVDGVAISAAGDGVAAPSADALRMARTAQERGVAAQLLVSSWSDRLGDFDPRAAHRLLSDPARVAAVATRVASYVVAGGWDGVDVDVERVRAADAAGLVALVGALQQAMPAERTVSVDVSASTSLRGYAAGGYDLAGLAATADVVRLMAYDQHGPTWSGPGPVGALAWQRRALRALLRVVPVAQVDLGVAGYGYTWPRRGTGRTVTVAQARRLVSRDGVRARWRSGAGEWTARLDDGTRLWWSDSRSWARRVALARSLGVHGLALWRLGSADRLS